jgi:hypothetical protein
VTAPACDHPRQHRAQQMVNRTHIGIDTGIDGLRIDRINFFETEQYPGIIDQNIPVLPFA